MRDLHRSLQDWRAAGLLDERQAVAIAAFERDRDTAPRRTVAAEAIGYVGAALALGAVALLVAEFWVDVTPVARLVLVAVLTLALAGAALALRTRERAPLQRLASVLFVGAVAGVVWGTAIVATDLVVIRDSVVATVVSLVGLAAAVPVYLLHRRGLPQLAVLVLLLVAGLSALTIPTIVPHAGWFGLTAAAIGMAWVLLGLGGWLAPARLAEIVGAVVALLALQAPWLGAPWALLVVGTLLAGALVAGAVASDALHLLAVGAIGLFLHVPRLVFELFGDTIGGPATMLVIGLLLVLLAVGVGRARREIAGGGEPGNPAEPPPSAPSAVPAGDAVREGDR